ncbi:VOC family protein [Candidatus Saccharibacteria bacterium]|nr:VOC family protein [Candidatus Saccharibacteria bacterium]
MLGKSEAFSGFTVNDINAAMHFYSTVLGLSVTGDVMGLHIKINDRAPIFVYEKPDHVPATYTILNFPIDSIDTAVEALGEKGVMFERYDSLPAAQDEKGILRGKSVNQGPDIAWFKDPAGNILSVLEN